MTSAENPTEKPLQIVEGKDSVVSIYSNHVILTPSRRDPEGIILKEKIEKTQRLFSIADPIRGFEALEIAVIETSEYSRSTTIGYRKVRMERAKGVAVDDERINTVYFNISTAHRFRVLQRYLELLERLNGNALSLQDHKPDSLFLSQLNGIEKWTVVDAGLMAESKNSHSAWQDELVQYEYFLGLVLGKTIGFDAISRPHLPGLAELIRSVPDHESARSARNAINAWAIDCELISDPMARGKQFSDDQGISESRFKSLHEIWRLK